jgi:hypothetical protein
MPQDNRYEAPKAELSTGAEEASTISVESLQLAHRDLNRARMGLFIVLLGFLSMGYLRPYEGLVLLAMLLSFILAHVFVGMAAARSGRSWVVYGLLPLVVPYLGSIIAFGFLRNKVPYADA